MKILLTANSLLNLLMGIILIFAAGYVIGEPSGSPSAMALVDATNRLLGFAVLAIAGLSTFMLFRPLSPELRFVGLGTLTLFHLGMGIGQLYNLILGISSFTLAAVHGLFFLLFFSTFVWGYKKKSRD